MSAHLDLLLDDYWAWLKDNTHTRDTNGWREITTPYLDRHNDQLQIYVQEEGDGYVLTDDGYIIQDLEMSGCDLSGDKRQDLLRITLNGFGIQREGDALKTHATARTFALKKHNLLQAMLAVNDMFFMAQAMVASLFVDDVAHWLDQSEIRYIARIKYTGKSGFDHTFDYAIPKSREAPERIVKAINHPDADAAKSLILAWTDTQEVRTPDSRGIALLNDSEQRPSRNVIRSLGQYGIEPILWSTREVHKGLLAS